MKNMVVKWTGEKIQMYKQMDNLKMNAIKLEEDA